MDNVTCISERRLSFAMRTRNLPLREIYRSSDSAARCREITISTAKSSTFTSAKNKPPKRHRVEMRGNIVRLL